MTPTRRGGILSALVVCVLALAGCAISSPPGYAGMPTNSGVELPVLGADNGVQAWSVDGTLVVTTFGSGSCPAVPTVQEVDAAHRLIVIAITVPNRAGPCTADSTPRTFDLAVGEDLDGFSIAVTTGDR